MQKYLQEHKNLFVILFIFVLSVILVNPFGNYAVNDDWDFYTHVRNFREGDFVKNTFIDSAFVLQGIIGTLWSFIFGFSFNSLRILTFITTILFILGVYKIFLRLKINHILIVISTLSIVFYPFIFLSSMTFMTEIYFLCLTIWSLFYLIEYFENPTNTNFYLTILLASLTLLVRQLGFLLVPVIILSLFINDFSKTTIKKIEFKKYVFGVLIFVIFSLILFFWPQYYASGSKSLFFIVNSTRSLRFLPQLAEMLFFSLPYLGLIFIPLSTYTFAKIKPIYKILILILSITLFQTFYKVDVFKFGNVLYPEGLMIRSNYVHVLSILDNIVFKTVFNFLCIFSFLNLIFLIFINRTKLKNIKVLSLFLLFLSFTLPVLIYDGFYDRYLINGLVILVLLITILINKNFESSHKLNLFMYIGLSIYILYSFILVQSFISTTKIQWKYAVQLQNEKDLDNKLFLNSTYTKFQYVFTRKNTADLKEMKVNGITYVCYVQKQVVSNPDNLIYKILNRIEKSRTINNYLKNPLPNQSEYLSGFRFPSKDPSKILYTQEYLSLPDLLVGSKTSIISYCVNNKKF